MKPFIKIFLILSLLMSINAKAETCSFIDVYDPEVGEGSLDTLNEFEYLRECSQLGHDRVGQRSVFFSFPFFHQEKKYREVYLVKGSSKYKIGYAILKPGLKSREGDKYDNYHIIETRETSSLVLGFYVKTFLPFLRCAESRKCLNSMIGDIGWFKRIFDGQVKKFVDNIENAKSPDAIEFIDFKYAASNEKFSTIVMVEGGAIWELELHADMKTGSYRIVSVRQAIV